MNNIFNWLYRFKYTKRGIDNLMKYVVIISAVIFALQFIGIDLRPILCFDAAKILHGQVWRIVTFIFIVPNTSIIFAAFVFYFYYIVGATLENDWGSFVFTVYYFFTVCVCAVIGILTGGTIVNSYYVNLAMFLAYGFSYPDHQILLFMFIPIKMKYLAWGYAGISVLWVITGGSLSGRLIPLCGLISFAIFFWDDLISFVYPDFRNRKKRKKSASGKAAGKAVHKCEVCGRTELDDPDLEFRFCSRCHGYHEYCLEHLYTHEHK